jgi:hypothetical protein
VPAVAIYLIFRKFHSNHAGQERSKWSANKAAGKRKPEAYLFSPAHPKLTSQLPLRVGYVEDFLEPRTKLEAIFSVLIY